MKSVLLCLLFLTGDSFARDPISVGVFGEMSGPAVSLDLTPTESEGTFFDYRTNPDLNPGFEVRYGHYGVAMTPSLIGSNQRDPLRPPTRYFDFRADYYGSRWAFEGYHQYNRGFYLEDPQDAFRRDNSSMTLQVSDLNVYRAIGSRSRMYRVTDGIKGTGWSGVFYGLGGLSRMALHSPRPLLGDDPEGEGTLFDSLARVTAYTLTAGMGATLNLNLFGLYADPSMSLAAGPQYRTADAGVGPWGAGLKTNLKLNLGYANDRFDVGMQVSNDVNSIEFDDVSLMFHSIVVRMGLTLFL